MGVTIFFLIIVLRPDATYMKKALLLTIALNVCAFAHGQESSHHMAFYGVDNDTIQHDTVFRLDSSHINIYVGLSTAFTTSFTGLTPLNYNYTDAGLLQNISYAGATPTPGVAFTFGFEYLSKESKKRFLYSIGLEVFYARFSGNISSNTVTHDTSASKQDSAVSGTSNEPYSLSVFAIDVPIKVYYKLKEKGNKRLSIGLGIVLGGYALQSSSADGYSTFNLSNPLNMGTVSLRYDVGVGHKTGLSFEPYFSMQMIDMTTHPMLFGIKIASL